MLTTLVSGVFAQATSWSTFGPTSTATWRASSTSRWRQRALCPTPSWLWRRTFSPQVGPHPEPGRGLGGEGIVNERFAVRILPL